MTIYDIITLQTEGLYSARVNYTANVTLGIDRLQIYGIIVLSTYGGVLWRSEFYDILWKSQERKT